MNELTPETCPERYYHGNPFRYCPFKGCGWMEPAEPCRATLEIKGDMFACTVKDHHATHRNSDAEAIWGINS